MLEPRSNTLRRNVFEEALVDSLLLADRVVIAAVFQSGSIPEADRLEPEAVAAGLRVRGTAAKVLVDAAAIVAAMVPELESGDVVAILSNGGFGDIYHLLPDAIGEMAAVQ